MSEGLTHIDETGRPGMVDVSAKAETRREATASSTVRFSPAIWDRLIESGFTSSKGSLLDVAIIAGTTGVKQTAHLIPFCHPIPISSCKFRVERDGEAQTVTFICTVSCHGRTGVEMEALTGASVAALALYDMTKALGHEITIEQVHLLAKTGGKSDYARA